MLGSTSLIHLVNRIESSEGKHISQFCDESLAKKDGENQCAHYVAHILGLQYGALCDVASSGSVLDDSLASIKVHEIFNYVQRKGYWSFRPAEDELCLAFLTMRYGIRDTGDNLEMSNIPYKHIGIFLKGRIYNYSNPNDRVHVETPQEFFRGKRAEYYKRKAKWKTTVELWGTLS